MSNRCTYPVKVNVNKTKNSNNPNYIDVRCGKCLACRKARRAEWSLRLEHQLHYAKDGLFVTLTYDNDHLPDNLSLRKKDLQLFMKRLRKRLDGRKIKYFACGEYGKKTLRPHYHLIIFNMSSNDNLVIFDSWDYADWSVDTIREKALLPVTPETIGYVTGYIKDKLTDAVQDYVYTETGREIPFQLQSKELGIDYVNEYGDKMREDKYIPHYGKKRSIPRYYRKKLELTAKDYKTTIEIKQLEEKIDSTVYDYRDDRKFTDYQNKKNKQRNLNLLSSQNNNRDKI